MRMLDLNDPADLESDRVLAHPIDRDAGMRKAEELGLPLHLTKLCTPGSMYVLRPSELAWPIGLDGVDPALHGENGPDSRDAT